MANNLRDYKEEEDFSDSDDDDEQQDWEDWKANGEEEEEEEDGDDEFLDSELLCLFCDCKYASIDSLFQHCSSTHHFDFQSVKKALDLDFYGSFKLLNYVRSQVAQNKCWSCGVTCQSRQELWDHLHKTFSFKETTLPWDSDEYLKPYMQEDPLLYNFDENDEGRDEVTGAINKEEEARSLDRFKQFCNDNDKTLEASATDPFKSSMENGTKEVASSSDSNIASLLEELRVNCEGAETDSLYDRKPIDKNLRRPSAKVLHSEMKVVNKDYFGSYGSFGIQREMISDKVRTDAYRQAIVDNPSLLKGAVVLDVGCGTGILSLFAAQAGASRVIAVEASDKMASVASQIAKDNCLLWNGIPNEGNNQCSGVVQVVHTMVEELGKSGHIEPNSVDVLVSEWMGYCLLYESMLSSVLVARDQWLKPGGAILPDRATIFAAGFGKGATSMAFWEDVYGFNMSSVGKELVEDAARFPIVDVVDGHNIVTNAVILQEFDLVTMKPEEVDFTATIELGPKLERPANCTDLEPETTWCYGIILWFDTSFSSRFCKEMPIVLSTSPYGPKTHWSQTILTFREPIAIVSGKSIAETFATVGTDACPAVKLNLRISIARGVQHRTIDISLETAGIGSDGRKRNWPVQMFTLL